jgi:hypothetical protein
MVRVSLWIHSRLVLTLNSQLTKEDEKEAGDEIEVRREDQDKINRFSRLHQRELVLEDELKAIAVSGSLISSSAQPHMLTYLANL